MKQSSTSTPIPNQVISRYCPATLDSRSKKKYVALRYSPRDLTMVNLDTRGKTMEGVERGR
jgi:hypothetical protein